MTQERPVETIGVVGGGAWGTALAAVSARAGRAVTLWAREEDVVRAVNDTHRNPDFLPGIELPPEVRATADLAALGAMDAVLLVSPAQHMRAVTADLADHLAAGTPVVICAKGIERSTRKLMSEVVAETLPTARIAALSGPTFAGEVARGLPTAVTLAAETAIGEPLMTAIGLPAFRPYLSHDVIGVQIGGAVKNVLAIAAGIAVGRALGENARAALITRGLAEILRLGAAKGAERQTLMGLSGLGDLILTANSLQSRNMSLGQALGEGRSLTEILGERRAVTEGVFTAGAIAEMAAEGDIDMPICLAMHRILNEDSAIDREIDGLLNRPFTPEFP